MVISRCHLVHALPYPYHISNNMGFLIKVAHINKSVFKLFEVLVIMCLYTIEIKQYSRLATECYTDGNDDEEMDKMTHN